jgi:hypothetical protein
MQSAGSANDRPSAVFQNGASHLIGESRHAESRIRCNTLIICRLAHSLMSVANMVHKLLYFRSSGGTMLRISVGVGLLAALLVTYWIHPTAAWVALFSTSTLALARHVRQRDEEAEAAFQRVDE